MKLLGLCNTVLRIYQHAGAYDASAGTKKAQGSRLSESLKLTVHALDRGQRVTL